MRLHRRLLKNILLSNVEGPAGPPAGGPATTGILVIENLAQQKSRASRQVSRSSRLNCSKSSTSRRALNGNSLAQRATQPFSAFSRDFNGTHVLIWHVITAWGVKGAGGQDDLLPSVKDPCGRPSLLLNSHFSTSLLGWP